MPVEYSGLIAEHMAVRTRAGLFDVSHMGEIQLRGPEALEAVQFVSMNDASKLSEGQAHYSALLTPEGTFIDDILVYKFSPNDYLLVVNAGTRRKISRGLRRTCSAFTATSAITATLFAIGDSGTPGSRRAEEINGCRS